MKGSKQSDFFLFISLSTTLILLTGLFSGTVLVKKGGKVPAKAEGITESFIEKTITSIPTPSAKEATSVKNIKLISSGVIQGYNYQLYENEKYPCGKSGNHEFLILQKGAQKNKRHLFIRFHGGAAGFYYNNGSSYWPEPALADQMLYADRERLNMFSAALGNGLAKLIRENPEWRILVPSYCSHDFYVGRGQYNQTDGFKRDGYFASKETIDFVSKDDLTDKIVATGTSAGASGAFYHSLNRSKVVGILMDSNSMDLKAIIEAYEQGKTPLKKSWSKQCDGKLCIKTLASRIGFNSGTREPHILIKQGQVSKPIYFIWNRRDYIYNFNAGLSMKNLHDTIVQYNPGGNSVAKEVCITNPKRPWMRCTIHSPTKYDFPETTEAYNWITSIVK